VRANGYSLLLVGSFNAINATLYDRLNFNFIRDIAPVATIYYVPNVMAVHPSFPAKTILEFIAYSKSNPGKVNMGSGTPGTAMHISGELFKKDYEGSNWYGLGVPKATPAEIV